MRFNDALTGSIILLFSVVMIAVAQTFPAAPGEQVGPDIFPSLIGAGLIICAVILIFRGIRERREIKFAKFEPWVRDPGALLNFALIPISMLFYVLVSEGLGFIPTSMIILTVLLYRLRGRIISSLVIAASGTAVIQGLFGNFLLVPLPLGILEPLIYG